MIRAGDALRATLRLPNELLVVLLDEETRETVRSAAALIENVLEMTLAGSG